MDVEPAYLDLHARGELRRRAAHAVDGLACCDVCPRRCRVDRRRGRTGFCTTGRYARVSSSFAHFGEEDCLRGRQGSGTIFFAYCNLKCVFCQNHELSHLGEGHDTRPEHLADIMLRLQRQGCHNINLVTPTHVVPQILEALVVAADHGLTLPLVYNTGSYDSPETLDLLDGVVDIYMPDLKTMSAEASETYLNARDYPDVACAAVRRMHAQVGDLVTDADGIARRGLLVRHLVMPGRLDQTRGVLEFLAREISPDTFVNVMPQYRPAGDASEHPDLCRPITPDEFRQALRIAADVGLRRLDPRRQGRQA